jgi:hypothetical protein
VVAGAARQIEQSLRRCEAEIEGRLSRALVQANNSRDTLRHHQADALRALARLSGGAEAAPGEAEADVGLTGLPRPS